MRTYPTLADNLMAHHAKKDWLPEPARTQMLEDLRVAHRFVIDPIMTPHLVTTATPPTRVGPLGVTWTESRRRVAKPPHRLTWIEFDNLALARELCRRDIGIGVENRDYKDVDTIPTNDLPPDRMGWLIKSHATNPEAFLALPFVSHTWTLSDKRRPLAQPGIVAAQWTCDESPLAWPIPSTMVGAKLNHGEVFTGLEGYPHHHTSAAYSPYYPVDFLEYYLARPDAIDPIYAHKSGLRYLWSILLMLNDNEVSEFRYIEPSSYLDVRSGRQKKWLGHHIVTVQTPRVIYLPNPDAVSTGRRHPDHPVRRHMRTLHRGTPSERKVWVREHRRGDPALGTIEHTTRVTHLE